MQIVSFGFSFLMVFIGFISYIIYIINISIHTYMHMPYKT